MTEDSGDHAWNDRKSWVPPPDQEYQDSHGWRDGRPHPGSTDAPHPGRILTGAEFIGRHVPPVWLIDGIVQRSRLYACTSLTGHGKTAVWLFNACMINAGRTIGQLDVFQGNVLILAGENPADLEARMIGMAKAFNLPLGRLPYVLPGSFPMTEEEADALKRDIAGLGVPLALIVGDTASSFFPGDDENSNVQAGTYARTLRRFNECAGTPAIVALCHPTKGASRSNLLPRGGGAFLNELDGNLVLWSHALGEVTELHWCSKIRGPDFSAVGYRLRQVPTGLTDEKSRDEMTIVAEPMSEEAVADHAKQTLANEDVVLRALRDHPDWSWAQIARETGWVGDDDRPERWKVQRALQTLADDKLIERPRKGASWQLTEKGEKVLNKDNQ
jgi:AAA domain